MAETNMNMSFRGYGGETGNSSRYDPTTMTRIVDVDLDCELDFGEVEDAEIAKKGRRPFAFIISLICIVGLAFSLSIGSVREKVTSLGSFGVGNLQVMCSPSAVSTKEGFSECESKCGKGDCCLLPANDPKNCAEKETDMCQKVVAYCAILSLDHDHDGKVDVEEPVAVPSADSSINEKCQWDILSSTDGYSECRDACAPGNCCYKDSSTCKVTNPEMCMGYNSCKILHVQELVTVPSAVSNIAQLCKPELLDVKEGYNLCKNACDPGQCCVEPIEACKVENPGKCSEYNVCNILHGTPKSHPSSIESKIVTQCNTNALSSIEDVQECKDLCQPAACCFTSNKDDSCNTPDNEDWCSQYGACQVLDHIGDDGINSHESAQSTVKAACSDESPDGLIACSNACHPANCCFDSTQNCFENGMDNLRCSHYEACGILYHDDKDPNTSVKPNPVAKDTSQESMFQLATHISTVCNDESLKTTEGLDECYNVCEDNLCCFADDEELNCVKNHGEKCVVYAACDNMVHGEYAPQPEDADFQTYNSPDYVEKPTTFYEELEEKCDDYAATGSDECAVLCSERMCCFTSDVKENCYNAHPMECDDYTPCAVLVEFDGDSIDDAS
mmetsp:Transcript_14238/g.21369  ORF Transcript_14238/g.21369 Transcript_14238/m.21369 type:complete len:616 (-) Transcript_14238:557-2404(-)